MSKNDYYSAPFGTNLITPSEAQPINIKKDKKVHPFDKKMSYLVKGSLKKITCREALVRYARDFAAKYPSDELLSSALLDMDERLQAARKRESRKPEGTVMIFPIDEIEPDFTYVVCLEDALARLGAGDVQYPYRPYAKMMFEPWLVEAALARFGDRRLTREEQICVGEQTRHPHKVCWPDWWEADLREKKGPGRASKEATE